MAQYLTIARPYASAVFNVANTEDALLIAWAEVLQILARGVKEAAILRQITDPNVTNTHLLQVLKDLVIAIAEKSANKIGAELENFLRLLIERKRLQVLPDMLILYQQLVAEQQKILRVEVSSAFELNEELRQTLNQMLSKRFNSQLDVLYSVDAELIGGAVIRTKEIVMDASIKGKLTRLYQSLNS